MEKGLPLKEQAEAWADEMKRRCCAEGETVLAALLSKFKGNADDQSGFFQAVLEICQPFIDFDPDILATPKVKEVLKARMNELFERRSKLVAPLAAVVDYDWAGIMKEASKHFPERPYPSMPRMPILSRFEGCVYYYREDTRFETAKVKDFMDRLPNHVDVAEIADDWVYQMVYGVARQLVTRLSSIKTTGYVSPKTASSQVYSLHKQYKSLKRPASEATSDSKRASVTVTEN